MSENEVVYFHRPEQGFLGFFAKEKQIIFTGITVHQEDPRSREKASAALHTLAEEDLYLYFEDEDPQIDFYAVPELLVVGHDSRGGHFATTDDDFSFQGDHPLFYISPVNALFQIEGGCAPFLRGGFAWRAALHPSDAVRLYPTRAQAERELTIHSIAELELPPEWNVY